MATTERAVRRFADINPETETIGLPNARRDLLEREPFAAAIEEFQGAS